MIKLITSSLLIIVLSCSAFPQSHPNSVYVELLGNGGLYSINYDRLFTETIGGRIGFMYFSSDRGLIILTDVELFLFPVMLNFFLGSGNHRLELGVGPVFGTASAGIFGSETTSGSGIFGTAVIGYRYQSTRGGLVFKIGFTPLIGAGEFKPWGGMSIGFSF